MLTCCETFWKTQEQSEATTFTKLLQAGTMPLQILAQPQRQNSKISALNNNRKVDACAIQRQKGVMTASS